MQESKITMCAYNDGNISTRNIKCSKLYNFKASVLFEQKHLLEGVRDF